MTHRNGSSTFYSFLTGAAVGTTVTLLTTPHSGRRIRRILRRTAANGREYLSTVGEEIAEKGHDVYDRTKSLVQGASQTVERGLKIATR